MVPVHGNFSVSVNDGELVPVPVPGDLPVPVLIDDGELVPVPVPGYLPVAVPVPVPGNLPVPVLIQYGELVVVPELPQIHSGLKKGNIKL